MLLYNSTEETGNRKQQKIFPSMNFSCSGNINKWTFVVRSPPDENCDQYLQFELWTFNSTNGRFKSVCESNITSTVSGQSEFTVEECTPDDPVPFEAGYIFGVYQAQEPCRRLVYVDVPHGYGYDSYYGESESHQFNIDESKKENNYPLVAVNTSEYQEILAEKSGTLQTTCSVLAQASPFFNFISIMMKWGRPGLIHHVSNIRWMHIKL